MEWATNLAYDAGNPCVHGTVVGGSSRGGIVAVGEGGPASDLPATTTPVEVWAHTVAEFVQVRPLGGELTVEIGYRVAWDEEHAGGAVPGGGVAGVVRERAAALTRTPWLRNRPAARGIRAAGR